MSATRVARRLKKKYDGNDLEFEILCSWDIGGHQVARYRIRCVTGTDRKWSPPHLACEGEGKKSHDSHDCHAKKAVRSLVAAEKQTEHGKAWKKMGTEQAILDIHKRVKKGEWFGQHYDEIIYLQEAAALLDLDLEKAMRAMDALYSAQKLDRNGMILADFKKRFRLPEELRAVVFRFVGDPLGYSIGDAGDGAIYEMERAIQKKTRCKDPVAAFGKHWPDMEPAATARLLQDLSDSVAEAASDPSMRATIDPKSPLSPRAQLASEYAEFTHGIRRDVIEALWTEFLKLIRDHLSLLRSYIEYRKVTVPEDFEETVLKEVAETFAKWAERFRNPPPRRPRRAPPMAK